MSLKRLAVISAVGSATHHHSNHSSHNDWTFHSNNDTNYLSHLDQQQNSKNYNQGLRVMRPGGTNLHGNVNILLGGAMLSVVTTIVCLICYCCHRKIKLRSTSSLYRQQRWLESDPNMEIYSVEQYFDTSGLFSDVEQMQANTNNINHSHNEPPPSYDEVISNNRKELSFRNIKAFNECEKDDDDDGTIMSTSSNTSSVYDLNQNQQPNHQNQSALCRNHCHSCNLHHIVSNSCENCSNNNLIITRNIIISNHNNNNNNNNSEQQEECYLETRPTRNDPNNNHHNQETDNIQTNSVTENDENGNDTNSINLNINGLIRLDMSQIMDHTGLPTYDAAIKLESSGYV